ncbi:hypothetical protein [Paraburkholderia phenoliruptrix]|uniref:Peptidase S9, prolyl oligopeptidase active site region n=2 Tax=Paraburkholderia phenoliruptrix TaxID=252970 RepID=K0E394_9BURK|nr:hypothetical protein [Paraburkholderia phenoliruptrix]AFT90244.1 Peptidase S9, prolyl oligopeptidase active site region [Paraburkholderia phenoliruptrix BR3459a]
MASHIRWVLDGFTLIYPRYDRALVAFRLAGADACIVREFDMKASTFVKNGFELLEPGHHHVAWIVHDSIYVGWDDSAVNVAPAVTDAGFPRQVRRWSRGTPIADAPIVFECVRPAICRRTGFCDPIHERDRASRVTTFFEATKRTDEWMRCDVPT